FVFSLFLCYFFFCLCAPPRPVLYPLSLTTLFRSRRAGQDPSDGPPRPAGAGPASGAGGVRLLTVGRSGPSLRGGAQLPAVIRKTDRKSTRLNSSHVKISYAVFCLKKKKLY